MAYVIGTAGHVDHGKSTLVEALSGIDPDRLLEEKEREMTIDLGFAWVTLPGGQSIGIIDVPGHRDFIENMLAGVGGIDAALFVVAADEGVMPQTREHLAILDLLAVQGGVVALTKTDLAEDDDWIKLIQADLESVLAGTVLQAAPIVPVSARTGQGLDTLLTTLADTLAQRSPRPDLGRPRLPIDRVFSISGFGTVVTGTLVDGSVNVGDEVLLLPAGLKARVRGIQSHKEQLETAQPGSRVALNLSGVEVNELKRGDVVAYPDTLAGSALIDVQFRHLADVNRPLKHDAQVKLFVGAAEVVANVRLLGTEQLAPGESGWLQLRLAHPIALGRGDRFILRYPSPGRTIGGGLVIDPHPAQRWRRFKPEVIERFETLAAGTPQEIIEQVLEATRGALNMAQVAEQSGMPLQEVVDTLGISVAQGAALELSGELLIGRGQWQRLLLVIERTLAAYHDENPLRAGMPREELRSRLELDGKVFTAIIEKMGELEEVAGDGAWLHLPDHAVLLSDTQQRQVDALLAQYAAEPTAPPSLKDAAEQVGQDVLQVLLARGDLIAVSREVAFNADTYEQMLATIRTYLAQNETVTVAEARDMFKTSRKYALALLEHLDQVGITKRVGDERVLRET